MLDDSVKLLLVDDEERNLDALESILASSGCYFVRARSADEALLALLNNEFAAIILDIKMPGTSGLELAQLIKARKRSQHVPILFLTAHMLDEKDVLQAYVAGGVDYLSKPVNPAILRSKVAVFADLFRTTRALRGAVEALYREIGEREKVQEQLRLAKEELETRVLERTGELNRANREVRENQARLSAIIQNTPALVYLIDADSRFVHINPRFEKLLGKANEEVRGQSVYDVLPQELALIFDGNNRRVLAAGETVEFEEVIPEDSGTHFYTSVKTPLFDAAGKPHSVVSVSTDITERKRLEDALRDADRRKDEFLAILAHELRNPIAPIRYALQVLNEKGPITPELRWAVDMVERQTQHMARLIDDLLDVNRITRNTLELRKEHVELSRIIESAMETSRPLIERGGHDLRVQIPSEPVYLDADVVRLAQVFSNLLNNAAKYGKGPSERARIEITAAASGKSVAISVKDQGVGIAAPMLPRIFDMFTQVGRSREQSEGGLGIGLSLAKRLVEMHGGTIEARSEGVGKGSEFIVTLPVAAANPLQDQAFGTKTGCTKAGSKRRILIADDNADVSEAFQVMLDALGHEVEVAYDGLDALHKGALFLPDVMVLDIGMPRLNGYDTARRIREQPWGKSVVLIAITGWGSDKDKLESEQAGFDIHLVKPVDPVALSKLLDSLKPSVNSEFRSTP
jgi:PAS domain S-box-containing protein